MCICTVDRAENEGKTYNSFHIYSLVLLSLGSTRAPLSAMQKKIRGFVQSYQSVSVYCNFILIKAFQTTNYWIYSHHRLGTTVRFTEIVATH